MSSPFLVSAASPEYRTDDRFRLHISGVTDLHLPFDGSIVLPRAPHTGDANRLAAMRDLDHSDWIFYSYLYPRAVRSGEAGVIRFPTLRDFDGKPFGLGTGTRQVAGKVLILAARGYTLLDDISGRALFAERDAFYSPRYPDNASLSSTPGVLLLHLDNATDDLLLPSGAQQPTTGEPTVVSPPYHVAQGFSPFTTDEVIYDDLKAALAGQTLHGEIYGFDLAGNIIDAYALALALDISPFSTSGSGESPAANQMFVQLVDAHGHPLAPNGTTLASVEFAPPLLDVSVGGAHGLKMATFPDPPDERKITVSFSRDDGELAQLPAGTRYAFRHTRVGLWPGFGHALKAVKPGEPVVLDLKKDFPTTENLPPFVRLCLVHPGDELQTQAGGEIRLKPNTGTLMDGQAFFADNDFRLFTDQNEVTVFNTGEAYFADLVEEVKDQVDEVLEGLYLTNWKSEPNVFLHGKMVAHGIARNDAPEDEIEAAIEDLVDPATYVVARLAPAEDPIPPEPGTDYLLLTRKTEFGSKQSFQMQVEALAPAGSAQPFIPIHRGFVRTGGPAAWVLTGTTSAPHSQFRLSASWKSSVGWVGVLKNTVPILAPTAPAEALLAFPESVLALGIDAGDPPKGTLRQVASYADLLAALVDGGPPFNDTGRDLRVIFLHLTSGRFEVVPLNRTATGPVDVTLHTFDRLFCADDMAVALVDWPGSADALDLSVHLVTHGRRIEYPLIAFEQGTLPLAKDYELGGWLRNLIATKPTLDLRALYWEHTQANLAPGLPLDRGFTNSAAMTAVLNRNVGGRRGLAIRDRSTRQLASFHQKAVVVVKRNPTTFPDGQTRHRVVAYVGGIDLSHGRWDTEEHHHLDPERQEGSGWRDVQMKIEGDAALDVLKNFTQRWQALLDFDASSPCRPVNVVDNMSRPFVNPTHVRVFDEPGPMVQITRTWPPASCHAGVGTKPFVHQNGELGSLESYLKAIRRAKKFILINDQYLFGVEIAQAIHEALLRPDGPECVMILLPMNLNEVEIVDPVIYKTRKRAIDTLYYGATFEGSDPLSTQPHYYKINPSTGLSLRDRIAILTPVNRRGDEIYVHSKHMIVDDVFMTIGSANFTSRGTTYEMEINAATVDPMLQQGGGAKVREQRIELCRRMLGLPAAYAALMQDWNACFHLFKSIETETAPTNPDGASAPGTLNLHPLPPMSKQLPPGFGPKLGPEHQAYNQGVSFVMNLDNNSPGMLWLVKTALDVDGRDTVTDEVLVGGAQLFTNIIYLYDDTPYFSEFPHSPPNPYGRLTFDLNPVKPAMIQAIDGGDTLSLVLRIEIHPLPPEPPQPPEPVFSTEFGRFGVTLDSSPSRNIVIATLPAGELLAPIHVDRQVDLSAELKLGGGAGATIGVGVHAFIPSPPSDGAPVTNGVFIEATVALGPPPPP